MGPSGPGPPPAPPAAPPRLPGPPRRPEACPPRAPARPTPSCDTQSAWPTPGAACFRRPPRAPGGFAGEAEQGKLRKGLCAEGGAAGGTPGGNPCPTPLCLPGGPRPPSASCRGQWHRDARIGSDSRDSVWDVGTQGEQTPTELVHPNCLVPPGPGISSYSDSTLGPAWPLPQRLVHLLASHFPLLRVLIPRRLVSGPKHAAPSGPPREQFPPTAAASTRLSQQ